MKTRNGVLLVAAIATGLSTFGQDWHQNFPLGNSVSNPSEYVGCDVNSTQSFKLKTIPDFNIEMYTSDIQRFALLPTETYATLGAYTGIIADGHVLICPDVAAFLAGGAPGPYSLQHLAAATNSSFADAYRDWMETGSTYTSGGSQAYVGQKALDKELTDLYIQTAKREGTIAPDRI